MNEFTREVLRLAGDEVKTCVQCGTCSASCPTAHLMDNSIRKLVKFVLEGMKDEALNSRSIWLCTSCLACTVRCPRGIRPVAVVSALKQIYEAEGMSNSDSIHEEIFNRLIKEHGRVSEFFLSAEYILRNPQSAARIISFGAELIPRGKINIEIRPESIEGRDEVRRIFEELGGA